MSELRAALAGPGVTRIATADGPDLRLTGLALGTWLAAAVALRIPQHAAVTLAVACVLAGLVLAFLAARMAAVSLLIALVPVFVGGACGAIATAARTAARDAAPLRQLIAEHASVHAQLRLSSEPQLSQNSGPTRQVWVVSATVTQLVPDAPDEDTVRLSAPALVLGTSSGWQGLVPGQRLAVTAKMSAPDQRDLTVALLTVAEPPQVQGRPPWYQRVAGWLRAGLQRACQGLPVKPGGLLPGLVDGDTSRMDPGVRQDFDVSGMSYLVVVAGTHLAIAVGFVLMLARRAGLRSRLVAVIGLAAVLGFAVLAKPGPSVARGATMAVLGLLAVASGRRTAALPTLSAAVFLLVMAEPQYAAEVGFTLSTMATAGLLLLVPTWRARLSRRGMRPWTATALAVSLAAQVACAPAVAATFGTLGVSAIPANMLAAPMLEPAMVLGLGATAIAPLSVSLAHALAWLATWPCRWLVLVAHYAARVPAGVLPWPTGLVGGLLLAGLLLVAIMLWAHRPAFVIVPGAVALLMMAVGGVSGAPATGRSLKLVAAPPATSSQCHARHGPLQDPACTPGAINPDVTQATIATTICRPGWTAPARPSNSYTNELKRQQIVQYGYLDHDLGDYEEDHLVPLSVGGSPNDPRNLWPEPGASPNEKDKVEADLQSAVCTHRVSLASAQEAIAVDWTTAEQRLGLG